MVENPCPECGQPRDTLMAACSGCGWQPASFREEPGERERAAKPKTLLLTRRGIRWFHWGLEATAGLILLGMILGMTMIFFGPILVRPMILFSQFSPYLLLITQLMMVAGMFLATAVPKQSKASIWAYATLLAGVVSTVLTMAVYQFRWPMQWAAEQWSIVFLQGILMAKFLAVLSRWIHDTEKLDVAGKTVSVADRKDVKTWAEIRDRFDRLFRAGVLVLVLGMVYIGVLRLFGGTLVRAFGQGPFMWLSVVVMLAGLFLGMILLMGFSRAISVMVRSFRDSWSYRSQGDNSWTSVPADRLRPFGISLGVLALAAMGGDWYAKRVMAPEYMQERFAEIDRRMPNRNTAAMSVIGKPAPEMDMQTIDGQSLTLSAQRGNVVLLNFWATWCGPCVRELPDLKRLAEETQDDGVLVIGVSNEPVDTLRPFVERNDINYPIVSGKNWAAPFDKITAVPTTYLIDSSGTIQNVFVGSRTYDVFHNAIVQVADLQRGDQQGRAGFQKALKRIEETVGDDPLRQFPSKDGTRLSMATILLALANLEQEAGNAEAEQEVWEKLAELLESSPEPDSYVYWGYLGQALYRVGRLKDSREALVKGIELRGETEPTITLGPRWWYLTMALAKSGETEEARQYYDVLVEQLGDSPTEVQMGFRGEAAVALGLEKVVATEPE